MFFILRWRGRDHQINLTMVFMAVLFGWLMDGWRLYLGGCSVFGSNYLLFLASRYYQR